MRANPERRRWLARTASAAPVLVAAVLSLTACGGATAQDQAATEPAGAAVQVQQAAPDGTAHGGHHRGALELWAMQTGPLGVVVTDGAGRVLHRSDADSAAPPAATCTGDCTALFPPVLVPDGEQPELNGVDRALVGSVDRPDGGRQLTLAGWPLYTFSADDGSLTGTAGDGVGGTWHAVTPTGAPAR